MCSYPKSMCLSIRHINFEHTWILNLLMVCRAATVTGIVLDGDISMI